MASRNRAGAEHHIKDFSQIMCTPTVPPFLVAAEICIELQETYDPGF